MNISTVTQYANCYGVMYSSGITSFIPFDTGNADYQRVQQWITAGGTVIL